jgi:hypothetical protein
VPSTTTINNIIRARGVKPSGSSVITPCIETASYLITFGFVLQRRGTTINNRSNTTTSATSTPASREPPA